MIAPHPKRNNILDLHHRCYLISAIAKTLDTHRRTVRRAVSRFRIIRGSADRPRIGQSRAGVTTRYVNVVSEKLASNPRLTMKEISKELQTEEKSVWRL